LAQEQQVSVAWELHQEIVAAARDMTLNRWTIARKLSEMIRCRGWRDLGHDTLEEYLDAMLPFTVRTGQALIRGFEKLDSLGVDIDDVADIGWTKIDAIVPVLNRDNVEYWLDQARELSVRALEEAVKEALHPDRVAQAEAAPVTRRFNLDTSQAALLEDALSTCKGVTGAANDAEAITVVCSTYLEDKGRLPLEDHIALLERRYGVTLIVRAHEHTEGLVSNEETQRIFAQPDAPADTEIPETTEAALDSDAVDRIFKEG